MKDTHLQRDILVSEIDEEEVYKKNFVTFKQQCDVYQDNKKVILDEIKYQILFLLSDMRKDLKSVDE